MPIAILELPPTWDAIKKVNIPHIKTKLGDGYEQIVAQGVIAEVEEWSIQSPALVPEIAREKLNQLRTFSGIASFYWSPDNELTIPRKLFTCEEWTYTRLGVTAHQIGATFKQVV